MATATKAQQSERLAAIEQLRAMLPPGSTVKTILRHVSRSGMSRSISVIIGSDDYSWLVARAFGDKIDQKNGGLKVGGCGMDMGYHVVHSLSATLYRDGFGCIGLTGPVGSYPLSRERCPSNDHNNGDRDYTPHGQRGPRYLPNLAGTPEGQAASIKSLKHWHKSGGYALRHEWL